MLADSNAIGLVAIINGDISIFAVARVDSERRDQFEYALTVELPPRVAVRKQHKSFFMKLKFYLEKEESRSTAWKLEKMTCP